MTPRLWYRWISARMYGAAQRPLVRPWALSSPILVLLICLPLLRPLRHPDPRQMGEQELGRVAMIQSFAEHGTAAIEQSTYQPLVQRRMVNGHIYSTQPPMQSLLMAGPYQIMRRLGLTLEDNSTLVLYLLTLFGITLPAALSAGLIYRMGRLFELRRQLRACLGAVVVLAGGLLSYGVAINGAAPAGTLLLASAACLTHLISVPRPKRAAAWLAVSGMLAALAGTVEPAALIFLPLFALVMLFMRWGWRMRAGGLGLYLLGALPPLFLNATLVLPMGGSWLPQQPSLVELSGPVSAQAVFYDEEDVPTRSVWLDMGSYIGRTLETLLGAHGLLSHYPMIILGLIGMSAILHRHWPGSIKMLAGATLLGGIWIILSLAQRDSERGELGFAQPQFSLFVPLSLFWIGAWLRKGHRPVSWVLAGLLLGVSLTLSVIGASDPMPRDGYGGYSAATALRQWINPALPGDLPLARNP